MIIMKDMAGCPEALAEDGDWLVPGTMVLVAPSRSVPILGIRTLEDGAREVE